MQQRIFRPTRRSRAAWLVPLAWACAFGVHASQPGSPALETTFGPPPMPSYWGQRIQKLAAGEPMLAGDYRIRAEVVLRPAGDAALASGTLLSPGPVSQRPDGTAVATWTAPARTRLSDFDTLVVEHGYAPGCPVGLDLALHSDAGVAARPRLALQEMLQGGDHVVMSEQPTQMEWAKKDFGYLLRRELGLPGDQRWRYAQDGDFTVIQRRLDVPLAQARTIELEFPSKTVLSSVNLSLGMGADSRANQLLSGGGYTSRTQDDGRRTRVVLYLGSALSHIPSDQRPHLKEILIAYQGTEAEVAQRKPLLSMRVVGASPSSSSDGGPSSTVQAVAPDSNGVPRWQSRFDLRRWPEMAARDVAALEVAAGEECAISTLQARLLSSEQARLPLFRIDAAQQLKAQGGPFLPPEQGRTEWLQWAARLPLAQAQPELRRLDVPGWQAELPGWHARWSLDGEAARIATTETGLRISGARRAQLDWTVDLAVQPGLHLRADMPSGAEQFASLGVELQLDTGAAWRLQIAPNHALRLPDDLPPRSRVRRIRVHFDPRQAPQDWTLAGLGVFRTYAVPLAQAEDQPRPGWKRVPQVLAMRDAGGDGEAGYQWDMPVRLRSGDLLQASITHGFGTTPSGACWLTVEATGDRGAHVRQRLCPSGTTWSTGLAELWSQGGFAANETVVSMRWTAQLSAPPSRPGDLAVALGVGASPSVRRMLSTDAGLRLGDAWLPLRPQGVPAALPALSLPVWLDYGTWTAAEGQSVPDVHWDGADLFELRRVTWVAAPALWSALLEQQQQQRRQALVATPSAEAGLRLQSAWLLLFAALVFWLARRAPALRAAVGRSTTGAVQRTTHVLQPAWTRLRTLQPAGARRWPVVAGTALAGLLAWLGGRGGPDAAWFALSAAALTAATCLRLWRTGATPPPAPLRTALAVLGFVGMAWVAGHAGLPQRPLAYAGLAIAAIALDNALPRRIAAFLASTLGSTAGLLAAASVVFYAVGAASGNSSAGESAWLTMGALLAIAAWWHMVQGLRPDLEGTQSRWARLLFTAPGGPLFAGAAVALVLSGLWLSLGGHRIAAHLATLFFYQWCIGALLTAVSPWARQDRLAPVRDEVSAPR